MLVKDESAGEASHPAEVQMRLFMLTPSSLIRSTRSQFGSFAGWAADDTLQTSGRSLLQKVQALQKLVLISPATLCWIQAVTESFKSER